MTRLLSHQLVIPLLVALLLVAVTAMTHRGRQFVRHLCLGVAGGDRIQRQGYRNIAVLIKDDWNAPTFGLLRVIRLTLHVIAYVVPTELLDTVMDFAIQKFSHPPDPNTVSKSFVGFYRELFYVGEAVFLWTAINQGWYTSPWVRGVAVYIVFSIVHSLLGGVLAWGKHSLDPSRNLVLAMLSYAQVTLAFAIFYLGCDCINPGEKNDLLTPAMAKYFSLVTASTVGYGDILPKSNGYGLVSAQLVISLILVLLVFTVLVSRVPTSTATPPNAVLPQKPGA